MMSAGKQSAMKRELGALKEDLMYNKEYRYMYEDTYDDGGRISAMKDPALHSLRHKSYRRKGHPEESCWGQCRRSPVCLLFTSPKLWTVILISVVIIALKTLITYEVPYCAASDQSGCSYNKVWLWECRPCPDNATCDSGKM